ncbi:hypothetical protein SAMN06893096_106203 [Geodermatophilus pulveris]|uniref:Uncharacterized protein n=1 Tax=Geodermatophilus pulveris TaxID=1564159 RepID=A0A239GKE9_9ACTN|nr:hypothetical protein [Geodermatophilus pulveris]SNS68534.1 hypothetical protein SAMN06893096_106203 [Geodermatophilus pulveris]
MRRYSAGLLATVVLLSACTGSGTTGAADGEPDTYELGGGARLIAPAGALPDAVDIAGGQVTGGLLELSGFPSAGAVEVTASDQPTEPVTVEIPVALAAYESLPADADDDVLVAHRHGGEDWEPLTGQLDRDRGVVTVSTDRLSIFDVRLPSFADLRAQTEDILNGILGNIDFSPDPPRCAREREARDAGYSVTSTRTSVLQWCLGLRTDGSPELKIIASRRYPLVAVLGGGFSVRQTTAGELGVRLAQAATDALTTGQITMSPGGTTTLDVRLQPGQTSRLVADFDGFAQSLVSLQVAAEAMVTIASIARPGVGRAELMDNTLNAAACAPKLIDLAFDVSDEGRVGSTVAACFDPDAITNTLGNIAGHIVLKFANLIGSAVAYVWNSTAALVDDLRGQSSYTITVQRAAPEPPGPASGAGCDVDALTTAVCRVVRALVDDDHSGLTEGERSAIADVTTVPATAWQVDGCEAVGDISAECLVLFDADAGAAHGTGLTFAVQPVNGEYDPTTGQYTAPPGEEIRYEVTGFLGYGP